jgi:Flp pilus assembly protein TadG
MRRLRAYLVDRRGAAAVELAFVLPAVLFLMLGGANLVLLLYASVSLNAATEAAARYASTYTLTHSGTAPTTGSNQDPVYTYAKSIYKGPGIKNLAFDYETNGTCGGGNNVVTGSGSYHLFYGVGNLSIGMNTTACFP